MADFASWVGTRRNLPALMAATLILVVLIAGILAELGSFVVAVRQMQVRADHAALSSAKQRTGVADGEPPQSSKRSYATDVTWYPPGTTQIGDAGSVRVIASQDFTSPLFRLRHRIETRSTVIIMPSNQKAGIRFAVAR